MAFWSSQRIEAKQAQWELIDVDSFNSARIHQGAYELSLSRDAIITPDPESFGDKALNILKEAYSPVSDDLPTKSSSGSALTIPPGQFALVYTEERIKIPEDVISFISVKAKVKLKGLVNISGFHVDPGYSGRLKFSLYNAGNRPICLDYGEPYFLIWFADLDQKTRDPYGKNNFHYKQTGLTADDREQMSEGSHSPAALAQKVKQLEQRTNMIIAATTTILVALIIPILIAAVMLLFERWLNHSSVPTESRVSKTTWTVLASSR